MIITLLLYCRDPKKSEQCFLNDYYVNKWHPIGRHSLLITLLSSLLLSRVVVVVNDHPHRQSRRRRRPRTLYVFGGSNPDYSSRWHSTRKFSPIAVDSDSHPSTESYR